MWFNNFLMGTHAFVTLSDKGTETDSLITQHYSNHHIYANKSKKASKPEKITIGMNTIIRKMTD